MNELEVLENQLYWAHFDIGFWKERSNVMLALVDALQAELEKSKEQTIRQEALTEQALAQTEASQKQTEVALKLLSQLTNEYAGLKTKACQHATFSELGVDNSPIV